MRVIFTSRVIGGAVKSNAIRIREAKTSECGSLPLEIRFGLCLGLWSLCDKLGFRRWSKAIKRYNAITFLVRMNELQWGEIMRAERSAGS